MKDAKIEILIGNKGYEYLAVPLKVAKAIITLLEEVENDDSPIVSATINYGDDV